MKILRLKFAARHNFSFLNMLLAKCHVSNDLQNEPSLKFYSFLPLLPKYVSGKQLISKS